MTIILSIGALTGDTVGDFSKYNGIHSTRLRLTVGGQTELQLNLLVDPNGIKICADKKTIPTHIPQCTGGGGYTALVNQYVQKCRNSMTVPVLHGN